MSTRSSGASPGEQGHQALSADDAYLWPTTGSDPQGTSASEAEFIRVYQNRKAIPQDVWRAWIAQATDSIDILAFAGTFLHDSIDDTSELLRERADAGVSIRLILGDPRSDAVGLGSSGCLQDCRTARLEYVGAHYCYGQKPGTTHGHSVITKPQVLLRAGVLSAPGGPGSARR